MGEAIHRLVYYSKSRLCGTAEEISANIHAILAASRRNNPRSAVTGSLMFNAGCFAQVLEGPSANVEHVFERIQQDDRHGDVAVLSFAPTEGRCFENWAMSFAGRSVEYAARYGVISTETGFDPSKMDGDSVFEALHRLVMEEETPA